MATLMRPAVGAATVRVGAFTLRPAQAKALDAVLRSIRRSGGVLIADPPGTGKTVLALAAAAALVEPDAPTSSAPTSAAPTLVIAPAALRAQWLDSAARAEVRIAFVSIESLSRGRRPARAAVVIVDEAHHARTPGTRRYARLAECCLGARVLLLTATPVVNRAADRDALLALFLGARATTLTSREQAGCIVRMGGADAGSHRPTVRRLGVLGAARDVPGLARLLTALPPPLPVAGGTQATALVLMSLAFAWRSSLAALDTALARRLQRGAAMRDMMHSGHHPTRAMLRHWTLHDGATQLAMGALFGEGQGSANEAMCTALDAHLDAVATLREHLRPHREADAAGRAAAIRALLRAHPDRRVVVFARHASTIRALHSALRMEPGVIAIVGTRVHAAAGRWSRDEVLRAIGPRSRPFAPDHPRAIRLLLATDVVAEGIEMQGVGIVVHADLPWTPARLEQRLGRVVRVGSPHEEVLEAHLAAPRAARRLLRLGARLLRKSEVRHEAVRQARAQAVIDTRLASWSGTAATAPDHRNGTGPGVLPLMGETRPLPRIASVRAPRAGFVAVVGEPPCWIGGVRSGDRWRVSSAPHVIAGLLRAAEGPDHAVAWHEIVACERRIARALVRREARRLAESPGVSVDGDAARTAPSASRRIAQVRARLSRLLAAAPALARAGIAAGQARMLDRLAGPIELARERRLDALLRGDLDDATFARRLGALLADDRPLNAESRPGVPGRLLALIVLSSGATCPSTTAP